MLNKENPQAVLATLGAGLLCISFLVLTVRAYLKHYSLARKITCVTYVFVFLVLAILNYSGTVLPYWVVVALGLGPLFLYFVIWESS